MSLSRGKKIALVLVILVFVGGVASAASLIGVFVYYGRGVAKLDEARLRDYRPPQVTRILSRGGTLLGEIYSQRRTLVDYEDIPSHVENAFLAAEDDAFYRHEGMDYLGMVRALIANVRAGEIRQGASTITQQVIKIFVLSPERTFERKVQELILAQRLEQAFTKTEILELYLNEIYLGHGRYGIEEASRFYFGTPVAEIDLGQAALLATLPKAPGRDSPIQNPTRAKERQIYVLDQMLKNGFISAKDAQIQKRRPVDEILSPQEGPRLASGADEFVDAVSAQLEAHYGKEVLDQLGAEVFTTVDLELQKAARKAVVDKLAAFDIKKGYARRLKPATQARRAKASAKVPGALAPGQVFAGVIVGSTTEELPADGFRAKVGEHDVFVRVPKGSRFDDPKQTLAEQFPAQAIVDVRILRAASAKPASGVPGGWAEAEVAAGPEAALVILDVPTGEVLAMVGGSNHGRSRLNRAVKAKRQPGSAFKPFVYGAALQSKLFTPATLVSDSPEVYTEWGDWAPTNFASDKYRGNVRMRIALAKSINTVAAKLINEVGIPQVQAFARAAGIASEIPAVPAIALGTLEVRPIELAGAYLTLARQGSRIPPTMIREVKAPRDLGWVPSVEPQQVLEADVVFVLTSMMRSVVEEGTATKAKALGRDVAGKTGTSNNQKDAWFAGFTRNRVGVAWVGFDQPRNMGKGGTGGGAALPVWLAAMKHAVVGKPQPFKPPASVSVRRIDADSGLLVPTGPDAEHYQGTPVEEFFLAGTEPTEEAVPAALPAGDVVLDLYGDEAEAGDGEAPTSQAGAVGEPDLDATSLDDDPPGRPDNPAVRGSSASAAPTQQPAGPRPSGTPDERPLPNRAAAPATLSRGAAAELPSLDDP